MSEGERRLAAVMFTDIKGYTSLTQHNEAAALALLQKHAELLRPIFAKHGGREVKMIGDSFLVEFSSALRATACAVEIQKTLYEYNVASPGSKIELRIGIHMGDVVHSGNDVFGDAVNIASRIEPLASPGSICISQQVYDQVWNKVEHPLVGLGRHELKNVQVPMEVYRIVLPWEKEAISGDARKVIPLVDRTTELDSLTSALGKAAAGQGGLVFVAGEAGVGKTRIAEELSSTAKREKVAVLYGRCSRREGKIPYAPWIEQIREFVRGSPSQFLYKVVGNYGAEVAKLVPEITASIGPVNSVSSGSVDQDRLRFMDGIAQLIVNISKEGPLLLIVDDMNWADVGSLDLMLTVARQAGAHRFLVVGIYRDVEVEEDSELFDFLYEVKREKLGESLTLKGFGRDDTGRMIGEIIGQGSVDPELSELVYAKTAGNPFFIEEVVRSMIEQGILFRTASGWDRKPISEIEIPSGVRTVIRQRLNNLDEESLGVLSVASVTSCESKEFSFALLKAVTGMEEDRLVDVMDRILRTRLIGETRMEGGMPGFIFTDTRIRDAIYDEMTLLRRGRYHIKTAQAIEDIYRDRLDDGYGVLAYHYQRANDGMKTCQYALKAADRASSVYAHADAAKYLKIALEALEDSPDKSARSKALEKLGEAERYSGRADYAKHLEEAAKLAAEVNEKQRGARIYTNLAVWSFDGNRENLTIPKEYFEKARVLAGEGETEEAARLYHAIARFDFLTGRVQEGMELAARSLTLSRKLDLPEVEAHSLLTLAITAPGAERDTKLQNMQKALQIGLDHNYYDVVMRAYNNLAVDAENIENGMKYAKGALSYFDKVGYKPYQDWAKALVAGGSIALGDLEAAKSLAEEFVSDPNVTSSLKREGIVDIGEALLYQGRFREAEEQLKKYMAIVETSEDFQEFLRCYSDLSILYAESENFEKSKAYFEKFIRIVREKKLDEAVTYAPYVVGGLCYVAMADEGLGDKAAALLALKEAKVIAERSPTDLVVGNTRALEGEVFRAEGKLAEAEAAYEEALEKTKKGNPAYFRAKLLVSLGASCTRSGHIERAKRAYEEAAGIYAKMKADFYLDRVRAAIAAIPAS